MNIRKFIPFLGGVGLFMVALWASNADLNLLSQEARADDPECTRDEVGYCLEMYDATVTHRQHLPPSYNQSDTLELDFVWHWSNGLLLPSPTDVDNPQLIVEVKHGENSWEQVYFTTLYDPSPGYHTATATFVMSDLSFDHDGHDYEQYEVRATIKFSMEGTGDSFLPPRTFTVDHPNFGCDDNVDNDGDYNPLVTPVVGGVDYDGEGTGHADPHCVHQYDNYESVSIHCSNGLDDDSDNKIDMQDPGCEDWSDDSEVDPSPPPSSPPPTYPPTPSVEIRPQCWDFFDNDGDGWTDYDPTAGDPQCESQQDTSESS